MYIREGSRNSLRPDELSVELLPSVVLLKCDDTGKRCTTCSRAERSEMRLVSHVHYADIGGLVGDCIEGEPR